MAEKTPAQQILDRLLDVRNKIGQSARQLETTLVAIRGHAGPREDPKAGAPATETRFFPAAELICTELEHLAETLTAEVDELARHF